MLKPSELTATNVLGSWVCGRVVLVDEQQFSENQGNIQSKGAQKGSKGKAGQSSNKVEIHLLGAPCPREVLLLDAWSTATEPVKRLCSLGVLVRVTGAKWMPMGKSAAYTTSRLRYFLRVVAPLGTNTRIEVVDEFPWPQPPTLHPLVTIETLTKFTGAAQVCVAALVAEQPGVKSVATKHGETNVCNAKLQHTNHVVRVSFWRELASSLAGFGEGSAVLITRASVRKHADAGWELHGNDRTQVLPCPPELESSLRAQTPELNGGGATQLTDVPESKDYETCSATPMSLSCVAATLVPGVRRNLEGAYVRMFFGQSSSVKRVTCYGMPVV